MYFTLIMEQHAFFFSFIKFLYIIIIIISSTITSSKCLIKSVTSWQKSHKSFQIFQKNICLICLDLKDFFASKASKLDNSPQATKNQRFRILWNLSN